MSQYEAPYILKRIKKRGSFLDNCPERAKDWDYAKNAPYTPNQFLTGSNKKVYWKCHLCGYEWPDTICNHAHAKFSCGQCAIKGRTDERYGSKPITVTNSELIKEWDWERNDELGLNPENLTAHDTKTKVNWICKRGHRWKKDISYRVRLNQQCPYCHKEIQTSFPEQALFYYFSQCTVAKNRYKIDKNREIDIYLPKHNIGIEYDGKRYHSSVKAKEREAKKNELAKKLGIRLIRVKESDDFAVEGYTIYAKFDNNYSYLDYAIVNLAKLTDINLPAYDIERDRLAICEQYYTMEKEISIASLRPDLLDEWDYEKNGNVNPTYINLGCHQPFWWKCKKGHSWPTPANARKDHGCPFCAGIKLLKGYNDLASQRPDLLEEWDWEENDKEGIKPDDVSVNNNKVVIHWICSTDPEHKWPATSASRNKGTGCPICAPRKRAKTKAITYIKKNGSFAYNYPELLCDWDYTKNDKEGIYPDQIPTHYSEQVWWKCHICGHEWPATPDGRARGSGCKDCYLRNNSSTQRLNAAKRNGTFAEKRKELLVFWDYGNNVIKPTDVTGTSGQEINWKCPKCNHQWPKPISKMVQYPLCPECKYKIQHDYNPIKQYTLRGKYITTYDTPKDAERATGIPHKYIVLNANHQRKSSNGFIWRYESDNSDIEIPKVTPTPKSVLQYDVEGNFIKEWQCIKDAEKVYFPHGKSNISAVCKGKRKFAAGFIWKYKESE